MILRDIKVKRSKTEVNLFEQHVERLRLMYLKLGFGVWEEKYKTLEEKMDIFDRVEKEYQDNPLYKHSDCLIVTIIAPAGRHKNYLDSRFKTRRREGETQPVSEYHPKEIFDRFNPTKFPTLATKPKLFILEVSNEHVSVATVGYILFHLQLGPRPQPKQEKEIEAQKQPILDVGNRVYSRTIPTFQDFLLVYSAHEGNDVDLRNGSIFLQSLCDVFDDKRSHGRDFVTNLADVSRLVQKRNAHGQVPSVMSSLIKHFFVGYQPLPQRADLERR